MTNNQRSISARRCGNKISPFVLDDGTVSKCALCNPNPQHRASIYSSYLMIPWDYTFQLDPERQTLVSPVCGVTRMGPCLASREQSCTTSAGVPPACHVSGVISHVSRARKTCTRVSQNSGSLVPEVCSSPRHSGGSSGDAGDKGIALSCTNINLTQIFSCSAYKAEK